MGKVLGAGGGKGTSMKMTLNEIQECVGRGWSKLLEDLYNDLLALGWDGKVLQVKEKFGGLRFYIDNWADPLYNRICEAEEESFRTCERCGEAGQVRSHKGWLTTSCQKCWNELHLVK